MAANNLADSYVLSIKKAKESLTVLREKASSIKEKKKKTEERLYNWMTARGFEEYGGIKRESIRPKAVVKRKPANVQKRDALELFRQTGINDPEGFWDAMQYIKRAPTDQG